MDFEPHKALQRPELTFKPAVSDYLRHHYEAADVILEYGSGGSTVMASEMPGKTIFSVESSRVWSKMMRAWFLQEKPASTPLVQHVKIGKTGRWGSPIDNSGYKRYHLYPLSIWDLPEFEHPDVVLVDGRFRVACALTTMMRATKPVTLLFDDYMERKGYHQLEEFLDRKENVLEMARFDVNPGDIPKNNLTKLIGAFSQTF